MDKIQTVKPVKGARFEGPLKVTGQAKYASDYNFARMAYAVPVCAKIAKGKIKAIDQTAIKRDGVLAVFTHENMPKLYRPTKEAGMDFRVDEARPPLEDDVIRYYGQYVAVVVAETYEIARAAADAVKVTYVAEKPHLAKQLDQEDMKKTDHERGDAEKVFASAEIRVDHNYVTPTEVHNPIELHATVAVWEGTDKVLLYETSQAIHSQRNVMAQILGIPRENVEVISKFLGSGFGGKLWCWPHSALAAASARKLGRPVKIVIDRHMAFTNVGHRPRTQQRIRIGATKAGKMQALLHDYASQSSVDDEYKENCGEVSGFLYDCPNVKITSGVARRNIGVPTSMRGPGAVPGLHALESAVDELAVALNQDPVQLRLRNDTNEDQMVKKPFSSRKFRECLELGAAKFGWSKRKPEVGSMKDGEEILGWGVAACTWPARRLDADVSVEFRQDGRVRVLCGTHDIGTGMYTVLANIASEESGVGKDRIDVELGDTRLPKGPLAGGSMATGSVVPAMVEAFKKAKKNLVTAAIKSKASPFAGQKEDDVKYENGRISGKKGGATEFGALLKKVNMGSVVGTSSQKGNFASADKEKFSGKSFGAQFIEIGWNPLLARLRVRRAVSVIDGGRIINYPQAKNQIEGALVMGIGMGLFEAAEYDSRDGFVVNANLADYVMPVHADMPEIEVVFLDYPDKELNAYGARGVGEIGLAGVSAAICNAVYHATGIRVRELPVRIEDLIGHSSAARA